MTEPTVTATATLVEAIDAIQKSVDRGAIVVDDRNHVVGIVTEGDIVRAVRRGTLTEALVQQVMTVSVRMTLVPLSSVELAKEFVDSGTLLVPVVDSERKLLDVQRTRLAVKDILS